MSVLEQDWGARLTSAAWPKETHHDIELEFIPGNSPELNPDEYLNPDLKKNVNARRMPTATSELKNNLISFMRSIQKQTDQVSQFFNSRHVVYGRWVMEDILWPL